MKKIIISVIALLAFSAFSLSAAPRTDSPAQKPSTMTASGKLTTDAGKFFVTDDTTKTRYEVRGENLKHFSGRKVKVVGQLVAGIGSQPEVIVISSIAKIGAATAVAGGTAAAAGVKAGLSTAAIVGVTGGATAATVGTLYATDVIGSEDSSVSHP